MSNNNSSNNYFTNIINKLNNSFRKNPKADIDKSKDLEFNNKNIKKERPLVEFLISLVLAVGLSMTVLFFFSPAEVEGSSMEPTFENGERVYTDRLSQFLSQTQLGKILNVDYKRGDVIVFNKPGTNISLIKRIIGLPGDKVEIRNGYIYINDNFLNEYYLNNVYTKGGTFLIENISQVVPQDSYFVAGDNRPVSNDSRYLGFIKREWMQGIVVFRIWPLNRFGLIDIGKYKIG